MTLTDFLLARLAEDEAAAEEVQRYLAPHEQIEIHLTRRDGDESHSKVMRPYDPARVLAKVKADRAIVAALRQAAEYASSTGGGRAARVALLALAQPYADHPNFDPAWRI